MEEVINKFESYAKAVAEELNKKISNEQFFENDNYTMLLYVEVLNEFFHHNSDKRERLFNVNDKEDVIRLLSKPYDFTSEYVCEKVTNTINEWSARFLYYNGEDGLYVITDQILIDLLQNNMVDIVKDVLKYTNNEVYQRFYIAEIFGLVWKE